MEDFSSQNPFSQFTVGLLKTSDLSPTIYHLQHTSGFNINIILYLLWMAKSQYGRLTKQHIKLILGQIILWHQRVVMELKFTHALVANHADPIAQHIKNELQIEIERAHAIERQMLYDSKVKKQVLRRSQQQQLEDACVSIFRYCELKNDLIVDEDQAAFTQLFGLVFHEMEDQDIEKVLKRGFDRFLFPLDHPVQMMWDEF